MGFFWLINDEKYKNKFYLPKKLGLLSVVGFEELFSSSNYYA